MSGAEALLSELLHCGSLDLKMLDKVDMDWEDVVERAGEDLSFNGVMRAVIAIGIDHIDEKLRDRIAELEQTDRDEEDEKELEILRSLHPEDDIGLFLNYLDTHAYLESSANAVAYREYLSRALDEFYDETGFEVEVW